ncbi:MAG TPA: hypothetical protein GXZ82_11670 [Firmicutes bacterium]|jgi:hypothetical protein|nr:hypothetical protein [Bacillota bacterium]
MNTWVLVAIAVLAVGGAVAQFFKSGESDAGPYQGGCTGCQAPCALAGSARSKSNVSGCHSAPKKA